MEKWKSVVIMALLGMMIGYGAFQQKKAMAPPPPMPATKQAPLPVMSLENKPAAAWAIPAANWMNTAKPIALNDLKGSVALIEFFRIKCPHCERAAPLLQKMYATYAPRGFKMIAFQSPSAAPEENDWATVKETVTEWGVKYPVAFDEGGTVFKSSFKGTNFPTFLLLDRSGTIRNVFTGDTPKSMNAMKAAIEAQLAKK